MAEEYKQPTVPGIDRKRIALVNGYIGSGRRIRIEGQVVDVSILSDHNQELWDPFIGLPRSQLKRIRPVQDMGMSSVRKPRISVQLAPWPQEWSDIPEKLQDYSIPETALESEELHGEEDGFFAVEMEGDLPAGKYLVRIMLRGSDSIRQSFTDIARIGAGIQQTNQTDTAIGFGRATILAEDYQGTLITSDIDQTFLDTKIESRQGLLDTLMELPDMKKPLAGMEELYRLFSGHGYSLSFISASPHFFRRTLMSVFSNHSIPVDSLHLKYLMGTLNQMIRKTVQTVLNMDDYLSKGFGEALDRSMKYMGSSFQSLFDQVSYKLETLLQMRIHRPTGAKEILMGDDTESDYLIFTLYQCLLSGWIHGDRLQQYLYKLQFKDREALTRDSARRIAALTDRNLQVHGTVNPVGAVWINRAASNNTDQMRKEIEESLPSDWDVKPDLDTIVFPVACEGSAGFAMHALETGFVKTDEVVRFLHSLEGKILKEEVLDAERIDAIISEGRISDSQKKELHGALQEHRKSNQ
ncbi:MAG: hypothetical protein KDK37_08415 [Leptospiraceae bacterium]|nr:hypothetical protein [Leptospiraceae bacterium]